MNLDSIRAYCLSFPGATEKVQWENHLLFNVGGKMFVITSLDVSPFVATLKPDPEHRLELLEMEGIEPAPYMARAGWISIRQWDTLRDPDWRDLIAESYKMIVSKLPKKVQAELNGSPAAAPAGKQPATKARASTSAPSKKSAPNKSTGKKMARPSKKLVKRTASKSRTKTVQKATKRR